jgi:hypothetical protein
MSIIQLSNQNFYLGGHHNKTLNINLKGFALVFFKMQNCPGCKSFEPIYSQLPSLKPQVVFAICDISIHTNPVDLSRQTNNPIQAVPWLVFYSDGAPIAKFKGKKNIPSIKNFIENVIVIAQQRKQVSQKTFMAPPQGNIYNQPQPSSQRYYKPEIAGAPPMQRQNTQYAIMESTENENDELEELPEGVIPHNKPWKAL